MLPAGVKYALGLMLEMEREKLSMTQSTVCYAIATTSDMKGRRPVM
jgi:hypothetical protein